MASLLVARGIKPRSIKPTLAKTCGISYEAVRQWFAGETSSIKNEHLVAIAKTHKTTIDWLLTGDGDMDAIVHEAPSEVADRLALGMALFDKATPRSQALIKRINELDAQGKLADEDVELLEQFIERFAASK